MAAGEAEGGEACEVGGDSEDVLTIVNIFSGMGSQSEGNLLVAVRKAGSLLVKAVQQAPQRSQFFREVGRLMVLIDEQENNAVNRSAIQEAFQGHNVALGASAALAPQVALAQAPATAARRAVGPSVLASTAKRELLKVIGAETTKLAVSAVKIAGKAFQEAVHERAVPLDGLHKKLKDVIAMAPQTALLGQAHNAMTIMGHVSNADVTIVDVKSFVESLLAHGCISFASFAPEGRGAVSNKAKDSGALPPNVTHVIREVRGQKILTRVRFACRGF